MQSLPAQARRGWLRTHWKAVVGIWLGVTLLGGVASSIWMHNSEATKISIAMAESNSALIAKLGRPLKTGWFISGEFKFEGDSGHAELFIPISGPRGNGAIYSEASKMGTRWHLLKLEYGANESGERLDLLTTPEAEPLSSHEKE